VLLNEDEDDYMNMLKVQSFRKIQATKVRGMEEIFELKLFYD